MQSENEFRTWIFVTRTQDVRNGGLGHADTLGKSSCCQFLPVHNHFEPVFYTHGLCVITIVHAIYWITKVKKQHHKSKLKM